VGGLGAHFEGRKKEASGIIDRSRRRSWSAKDDQEEVCFCLNTGLGFACHIGKLTKPKRAETRKNFVGFADIRGEATLTHEDRYDFVHAVGLRVAALPSG